MHIDAKSKIAQVPAIQVRDFLRSTHGVYWPWESVADSLALSAARAKSLVSELLRLGYIERSDVRDGQYYHITLTGSTFALASAARPLTRQTAERKLDEFLDRVRAVNAGTTFAFRVRRALVFGSYLTDQERIDDIDIAIELAPREKDPEKRMAANEARIRAAHKAGRHFSNAINECMWPTEEVYLFLKSRSSAILLYYLDDEILQQTKTRVIYPEKKGAKRPRASTAKGARDQVQTDRPARQRKKP
jgi:predicted nucleotidyltransferase